MALLPGLDYPTAVVVGPLTLNDGQILPSVILTLPLSSQPRVIVDYSVQRGTIGEVGRWLITNNGSQVSLSIDNTGTSATGVTFTASISGSNLNVQYTSTSTGQAGQFWYTVTNLN